MAVVNRYKPNPVYLPEQGRLSRTFYKPRSHLPNKPVLTEADYQGFETHTIFNDIFIHADGSCIQGIGPPLVNLGKYLLPMQLSVQHVRASESVPLKPEISNFDRVSFFRFALPAPLCGALSLDIQLRFANGLQVGLAVTRQRLPEVELQIVTLQKNNPVEWIVDWLRYIEYLGVDRVLLYDNGSDKLEQLASAIAATDLTLSLLLIEWRYPYGPMRSYYNQFCQASQNNHGYQCFAAADWVGHFDIDEYPLQIQQDKVERHALKQLVRNTHRRVGLLRMDSYWVPRLDNGAEREQPEPGCFHYRMRHARGRAHKYLMRASAHKMSNTHNGRVRMAYFRKQLAPDHWAFLHYKALTTNWRDYVVRGSREEYDPDTHIRDSRIAHLFDTVLRKKAQQKPIRQVNLRKIRV